MIWKCTDSSVRGNRQNMIYDGFIFYNEIELLELRLKIMGPFVDKFIIVESRKTFTNEDKELFFDKFKERFDEYLDKIIYIVVDDFPVSLESAWDREHYQRAMITDGIKNAEDDDILIVTDVDEIISPYGLKQIKKLLGKDKDRILNLELLNCWYFLNYVEQNELFWSDPRACCVKMFRTSLKECCGSYPLDEGGRMNAQTLRSWSVFDNVPCAGWHFSYMGGVERIKNKVKAFSHQEYNTDEMLADDRIIEMIKSGRDLFGREFAHFASVPAKGIMPKEIVENMEKYETWVTDINPMPFFKYLKLRIKYFIETKAGLAKIYHMLLGRKVV